MGDVVRVETIVEILEQSRSTVFDEHGNGRTCAEILAAGRRLANDLAASGVRRGDRIAVQMKNGELYVDVLAAAAIGGFVIMSVNTRFAPALGQSLIERSGARSVIRSHDDLPTRSDEEMPLGSHSADDRFVIFTTSGTTSAPKLVVHQQRSIAVHAGDIASAFGYTDASVVLVPVPLCGVFGMSALWGALAGHSTVYMPTTFEAEETGRMIQEHGVTAMHGSDDLFHRLVATDWDLSSIECSGYARFNSALDGIVEQCRARGVTLRGLYGMSEVQALYSFRGGQDVPEADRWKGGGELVSAKASYRIVNEELQLQGPSHFEGYLADGGAEIDRELTAANFDGPWFKTGDLAIAEGERSFEYVTRIGDVMRLGGFLVAPAEVEGTIIGHADIEQAQVVAVGREQGARPVAFVIMAPHARLDEQAVIDHCAVTLARFKCPVRVVAVDEFPVTDGPNGVKIQRQKLRDMGAELLAE